MTTTLADTFTIAGELADAIRYTERTAWTDIPDGSRVRVTMTHDDCADLRDFDYWGVAEWTRRDTRPSNFDGSARKLDTAHGQALWWQPPEDAKRDAALLARLERHVRGWYRSEWHYVIVEVERELPPCGKCHERPMRTAALGGVESDVDAEYLASVIMDLLTETA